jgi:hypothetical protein
MSRSVTDNQDERTNDNPDDGTDAPASLRCWRHHSVPPALPRQPGADALDSRELFGRDT